MKSPNFGIKVSALREAINKKRLKESWGIIGKNLRRQAFLDVIEYKDISIKRNSLFEEIIEEIKSGAYRPMNFEYYTMEKAKGLCRQIALCHPKDLLTLETLTNYLKKEIVDNRPYKKAYFEPDEVRKKFKFELKIDEYSSIKSWKDFQSNVFEFTKERKFIVITDISNFYDNIRFADIRNVISSICKVKEEVLDLLIFILNEMSWTPDYMPRSEIGLPQIESNAPRVLANAILYELDIAMKEYEGIEYIRFMDDIDVGVDEYNYARKIIRDIDMILKRRHLRLNSSKTKILTNEEAEEYFCIKENMYLSECVNLIEREKYDMALHKLKKGISIFNKEKVIEKGNGEKIYKFTFKLINHLIAKGQASEEDFKKVLTQKMILNMIEKIPSMRLHCLTYISFMHHPIKILDKIKNMILNNTFIDDYSIHIIANFILHTNFKKTNKFENCVYEIVKYLLRSESIFHIHAALLIYQNIIQVCYMI